MSTLRFDPIAKTNRLTIRFEGHNEALLQCRLFAELIKAGYEVLPEYTVGGGRLDLAVFWQFPNCIENEAVAIIECKKDSIIDLSPTGIIRSHYTTFGVPVYVVNWNNWDHFREIEIGLLATRYKSIWRKRDWSLEPKPTFDYRAAKKERRRKRQLEKLDFLKLNEQ